MIAKQILLSAGAVIFLSGFAFGQSTKLVITPPTISNWGNLDSLLTSAQKASIQTQIQQPLLDAQNSFNSDYLSKLKDFKDLSRGFANSNAAASDNVPFLGFQNYDYFTFLLGTNVGFSVPSLSVSDISNIGSTIKNQGDVYAGLASGGVAGQFGLNTSTFLVKGLYITAKFGIFNYSQSNTSGDANTDVSFKQIMFGLGVNYRLVSPTNIGHGFLNWRGLSVGTGISYNSNDIDLGIGYTNQTQTANISTPLSGNLATITSTATLSNIKANLNFKSSSLTIPVEIDTSVQLLWLLNLGLGLGADINIPTSTISLGGNTNAAIAVADSTGKTVQGLTFSPATATITGGKYTSSAQFFDVVSPRISADLGLNIAILKFDVPLSYYPVSKTFTAGFSFGLSW